MPLVSEFEKRRASKSLQLFRQADKQKRVHRALKREAAGDTDSSDGTSDSSSNQGSDSE